MKIGNPFGTIGLAATSVQGQDCPNCYAAVEIRDGVDYCPVCGPLAPSAPLPTHDPKFSIFAQRDPVAERLRKQAVANRMRQREQDLKREEEHERKRAEEAKDNPEAGRVANAEADIARVQRKQMKRGA